MSKWLGQLRLGCEQLGMARGRAGSETVGLDKCQEFQVERYDADTFTMYEVQKGSLERNSPDRRIELSVQE
jgi:hypothetical protein